MSSRIRSASTSSTERCPSPTPAAFSVAATAARRSPGTSEIERQSGSLALGELAVGGDDPLHELVADDVLAAEADEGDVVDRGEDLADDDQAGALVARQVDLGDVAGDHHLRAEAEPGEEHLHLLGARVLGLVEDDEGVIQASGPA